MKHSEDVEGPSETPLPPTPMPDQDSSDSEDERLRATMEELYGGTNVVRRRRFTRKKSKIQLPSRYVQIFEVRDPMYHGGA